MDKIYYLHFAIIIITLLHYCNCILLDDDDDESPWNRCPWIRNKLKNGRVKIRNRGRIAKFLCDPGYELAGKRFATCIRGQWNNPVPMCVARGCFNLPEVANGRVTEMYRGAVLMYDCLPGYTLEGSSTLYCDGRYWTSVVPVCSAAIADPQTSCDFEDPDLCGWIQDPTHDFDWKRNQYSTPSGHAGTGPSYDHTFGENKGGFYLYLEVSSPRKPNDVARLFSPVYDQDKSGGCFLFWYHMYGSTTGGLKVYIKPESHVFGELPPVWELFGDQGDSWIQANISIPNSHMKQFQIVIEGIRGLDYIGDTAIDDVYLTTLPCDDVGNSTENISVSASNSCRGRCRESDISSYCGCNDDCHTNGNCCFDFDKICTGNYDPSNNENLDPEEHEVTHLVLSTENVPDITTTSSNFVSSSTSHSENISVTSINIDHDVTQDLQTHSSFNGTTSTSTTSTANISSTTTVTPFKDVIQTSSTEIPSTITIVSSYVSTKPSTTLSTSPSTATTTVGTTTTSSSTTSTTPSTTIIIPFTSTASTKADLPTTTTTQSITSVLFPNTTEIIQHNSTTEIISAVTPSSENKPLTSITFSTSTVFSSKTENFKSDSPTGISSEIPSTLYISSTVMTETSRTSTIYSRISSSQTSTVTSSSVLPSSTATLKSTPTTRTYNLRPRNRTTSVSSTTKTYNLRPRYSTTTSTTSYPYIHIFPTPLTSSTTTTTSRNEIRTRPSFYSYITTNNVKYSLQTTTESSPIRIFSTSKTSFLDADDTDASKSAATAVDDRKSTVTIVSIVIVIVICVIGIGAYLIKKRSQKRQSKLSDDSEMRFLSENEVVDYSDPSALDRMLQH